MPGKPECSQNWAFGAFELEGRTAELRRNGVAVRLQEQPSQLLLFLLQHAGQIVTREDLRMQLWPADTFVDFDHALNTAVMKLREALGDSSEKPLYIQTLPRKGYRFVAPAVMLPSISGRPGIGATFAPSLPLHIMGPTVNDDNVSDLALSDAATPSKSAASKSASGDLQATDKAIGLNEADFIDTPVQTGRDLSRELKWISEGARLTEASEPAPRPRQTVWKRLTWGMAALCLVMSAWLGVAHWRGTQPSESRHLRLSLLPPPSTSFVSYDFAISPDGRRLAFVAAAQDGGTALWIRSLAAGTAQQLTGTEGAMYPFWSPDSRQVGFFQASKLKSVDPGSGAVQILCDAPGGFGGAWNDRGTIIFAGDNWPSGSVSTLFKVSASGGEPELATKGNAPSSAMFWPSALPDGDHFLYFLLGSSTSAQKQGIYVGSLSTRESKLISSEIVGNTQFASSRLYYVRDRSLMAQPFDVKRLQITGPQEAVSRQELEEAPAFSRTGFSVSDNGVVVFQSASESVSQLSWFDRSGQELEGLPRASYRDPALSRDGALLAVSSDENHNGRHYIYIYDFARGTSTRVSGGGTEVFPVFSPDGKRVAYVVNNARTSQYIDVAATDGSGKLERLAASDFLIPNDWSADGRFLVYMNFQNGAPELDLLDLASHSRTVFGPGAEAQFSPDGKWIAFTGPGSTSDQETEVYVAPIHGPGRRIQISNHGGAQARWRADGKELFYITKDKKLMTVAIDTSHHDPIAGLPHVLFQTRIIAPRVVLFQYAVSPDGKRFLINSMPSVGAAPLTVLMN